MRLLLAILAALLALVPATLAAWTDAAGPILARPVALVSGDPWRTRVGPLTFLGGWELTSRDRRFGGFSAIARDGDRLLLASDAGVALDFRFDGGGIGDPRYRALGSGLAKGGRDVESLARDPVSGRWWIGIEALNAIARWSPDLVRREAIVRPPAMRGWGRNGGAEAMTRLADGRFLLLAEDETAAADLRDGLLFAADPTDPSTPPPLRFTYRPPSGFDPSDIAVLPDGRLLVLNRRATLMDGFSAVLTLLDPAAIRNGTAVDGPVIATLASPMAVDNLEGLMVERLGGRTILWFVSDDNFLPVQRTLLLRFLLDEKRRPS